MRTLCWCNVQRAREFCSHLSYQTFPGGPPTPLHDHDFAELFWIESGAARHDVNGARTRLEPGDLVLLRPRDRHTLRAAGGAGGVAFFNLAFPAETWTHLRERYLPEHPAFVEDGDAPPTHRLSEADRRWLRAEAQTLAGAPASRLALERFLLNLLHELGAGRDDPFRRCPDWLRTACEAMRAPVHFRAGVRELSALAGRSHEHVARVLRKCAGLTPGELVTRLRMEYAVRELLTTDRTVLQIALDSGYESPSRFHTVFRRFTGLPPRRYR
ncbi:MAG: AraC family transcriptional regulator, partial [Planctomycetota bacterium]